MESVHLELGDDSYQITIGAGLMSDASLFSAHIHGANVLVVTNETIAPIYLNKLLASLSAYRVDTVILPDGESYKTLSTLNLIFDKLLACNHNRQSTIVALGGGVVGDMAGFAAASYQRGIDFIQVPTTLLSQVDSSVGGKTAVNHALGKNMIGAFHQPNAVVIDTDTLQTLPPRELAAGLAEVIKHGALADLNYFDWLEENMPAILQLQPAAISKAIRWSCEIKSKVVSEDEKEHGRRALLNFGHTFGHAIENSMGYGKWLHGEAVAAGMVMAADLSCRLQLCSVSQALRLKKLIASVGLPVKPPESVLPEFLVLMGRDKKASDAGIRFVLLDDLGQSRLVDNVDSYVLQQTLDAGEDLATTTG